MACRSSAISSARPGPPSSAIEVGKGEVQVWRDTKAVFSAKLPDLHQVWDSVSWKICQQRDNPACADAEHAAAGDPADPGLHVRSGASIRGEDVAAPYLNLAPAQGGDPARAGRQLARRDGLRLHRSRLRSLRRAHDRPAVRPRAAWRTSRASSPAAASATATRWAPASAGRAASPSTRSWRSSSRPSSTAPDTFAPGRVQRLPDAGRAGRHHSRRAGLAALHHQPQRALRGAAVAGGGAGVAQPVLRGHGGQPPADRGGARRGLSPTSRIAATRPR